MCKEVERSASDWERPASTFLLVVWLSEVALSVQSICHRGAHCLCKDTQHFSTIGSNASNLSTQGHHVCHSKPRVSLSCKTQTSQLGSAGSSIPAQAAELVLSPCWAPCPSARGSWGWSQPVWPCSCCSVRQAETWLVSVLTGCTVLLITVVFPMFFFFSPVGWEPPQVLGYNYPRKLVSPTGVNKKLQQTEAIGFLTPLAAIPAMHARSASLHLQLPAVRAVRKPANSPAAGGQPAASRPCVIFLLRCVPLPLSGATANPTGFSGTQQQLLPSPALTAHNAGNAGSWGWGSKEEYRT